MLDKKISRFVLLRQFESGSNSAATPRLLDRLEWYCHITGLEGVALRLHKVQAYSSRDLAITRYLGEPTSTQA